MARNAECLIIILDVRETANDEFKLQSVKCASEILKDKICAGKKDIVNFVLVGTHRTQNLSNENASGIGYTNIVQYPQGKLASWNLLIDFYKFVNEQSSCFGEWLDAIAVAMDMMKDMEVTPMKYKTARILLFYDFNGMQNNYDEFNAITNNLVKDEVSLIVVSPNIFYIDNPESGEPQAIFCSNNMTDKHQLENEKYAMRLVSRCNATLCNCKATLHTVFKVKLTNPWTWNAKLQIGTKINILITGIIVMKDTSNIKLQKCWGEPEETISRVAKFFHKGQEIQDVADLIDGYMLGATPVAVEDIRNEKGGEAALKFVAFTKSDSIPTEYYCSDSLYWIMHRKGYSASAKKFDALVKALNNMDMVMLCWRIYSATFNNPKLVVLLPNEPRDDRPSTLMMIELAYHSQHQYWNFPALCTKRTDCTAEQYAAIDELIDSMDLMQCKDPEAPREARTTDALPFDTLPHIYEQNMMDFLERKIICNASETDEQFEEMLKDKNFVDQFWKVPEAIEEQTKKAAQRVKRLFPLEQVSVAFERAKIALSQPTPTIKAELINSQSTINGGDAALPTTDGEEVLRVDFEAPAANFQYLLKANVSTQSNLTARHKLFDLYALQMRSVIWALIFEMAPQDTGKITKALSAYRESCCELHRLEDYNNWLQEVKEEVLRKELLDFWRDVVVAERLGIIALDIGALTVEEQSAIDAFYAVT